MISRESIETFQAQGAVYLSGVLKEWVDLLRRGVDANMASPGPFVRDYKDGEGGRFFGDYCNWRRFIEYKTFLFDSPAADIARQLMGSETARLFHEHVLVKEPGTNIPTPWHHDQPYYCVNGAQNVSLWMALDPVDKQFAVEFIAGSHRWDRWFRPERFDRTPLYERDTQETLPDIESNRDDYDILKWEMQPGDVVAFHYLTLHGAPGTTTSALRRRGFSSRWVGDDATFAVRAGKTSPPFPECCLQHGEPLDGPEFPLVRDASSS